MEDLATITGRIIPSLLVTQLKALIKSLNESIRPPPQLKLSGNKSELINRLVRFITDYHNIGDQAAIRQIRNCIAAFNQGEVSTISTSSVALHHPQNSSSTTFRISQGSMLGSKAGPGQQQTLQGAGGHHGNSMSAHRSPQHPPSHSHHVPPQYPQHRSGIPSQPPSQSFKSSPFYRDIQTLTTPRLCIEAKDRTLSVALAFSTPPMVAMQLKKDPECQLMVFCGWADGPSSSPVLMEFPHVCEIKVNGRVLEANLRGMKNKPGTVSPANITRLCRVESAEYNKIEFIYANSTKRYLASTHLVKKISVESIVAEIERGKFLSKEKMLRMIEDRNKDDDIMATSSTLSLKCPLGFQRITIPCRSSYCQHLQCFDAFTFFNLNEQTPTWTCPVCSRNMHSWEEIVVDGYFKDILSSTPKSLESITVQADGSWELPSASSKAEVIAPSPKKKATLAGDVYVLDDDDSDEDEDEDEAAQPATPTKPAKPAIEIIDLISDSEDEAEEPPSRTAVDEDGDHTMQEAANSLQTMAQSTPGAPPSVKAEVFDISTPTESDTVPPPPLLQQQQPPRPVEIHSIIGSTNVSRSASSEASPVISTRMVQTEPLQTGPLSPPASRPQPFWETNEDVFTNALLNNPRRKRQFDDTGDNESPNSMAYEARQRIARLDIHSNTSSDRGSSSTMPSPDVVRRSTSSPTPVPSFHDLERRGGAGVGDHHHLRHGDSDDNVLRLRREQMLNRSSNSSYYENGSHPSSGAPLPPGQTVYAPSVPSHFSPHHRSNRSARSVTMSPPLHHVYKSASPHYHHHPTHRSTNSPGPDYYSSATRPSSSGSMSASASVSSRPNSGYTPSSVVSAYGGPSSGWSGEAYTNGSQQDRVTRAWSGDQRPSSLYAGRDHLSYGNGNNSPRRVSADEARSSNHSGSRPSSPAQHSSLSSSKYPSSHQQQQQQQQQPITTHYSYSSHPHQQQLQPSSSSHHRHRSTDDTSGYGRREDRHDGPSGGAAGSYQHYHRASYSIDESDERKNGGGDSGGGSGYGSLQDHHQHVYSSNQGSQSSVASSSSHHNGSQGGQGSNGGDGVAGGGGEDRSGSKDDEAPIFLHGLRGARAR